MFRSSARPSLIAPVLTRSTRNARTPLVKPFPLRDAADTINNNLLVRYLFGEGGGTTILDMTSGRRNISTVGSPIWTTGLFGAALSLSGGATLSGSLPAAPSASPANFSILVRCSMATAQTNKYLMNWSGNGAAIIYGFVAGQFEFYVNGGLYTGTDPRTGTQIALPDANTHTICYTYDGITQRGYLDGVQSIAVTKTFSLTSTGTNLIIGGDTTSSGQPSPVLDHFAIFQRALSADEVFALSNNPLEGIGAIA